MLIKRIISSLLIFSLLLLLLSIEWACGLFLTFFIIGSLYEFFRMLEKKGINVYKYFGLGIGAIIPLSIVKGFELTKGWEFLFIVLVMSFLILLQFKRRKNAGAIVDISTTIFGILYISWLLSFLIKIRYLPGGLGYLLAILFMTKLGDIGAYFIGSRFGKTPLIPRISPKKSIEGAIGGLLFSVFGALISQPFLKLGWANLVAAGICFGVLGQLGDLSESMMKRDCEVKDSGNAIPGMGGFLDLVDSLIFSAPVFYFYVSAVLLKRLP